MFTSLELHTAPVVANLCNIRYDYGTAAIAKGTNEVTKAMDTRKVWEKERGQLQPTRSSPEPKNGWKKSQQHKASSVFLADFWLAVGQNILLICRLNFQRNFWLNAWLDAPLNFRLQLCLKLSVIATASKCKSKSSDTLACLIMSQYLSLGLYKLW